MKLSKKQLQQIIQEEIKKELFKERTPETDVANAAIATSAMVPPVATITTKALKNPLLRQLMKASPKAATFLAQKIGVRAGAYAATSGGLLGTVAGAVLAGAAIGAGIGLGINASIDWAQDALKHRRTYSADVGVLSKNVRRLVKQAKSTGINGQETEELVHSWIGLAGKDKKLAAGYVEFLKFLRAGPWGKHFPAYITIKK
jgi:hypothetical protein